MFRKAVFAAAFMGALLVSPASAKKPAAEDEAVLRSIIERLYKHYTEPLGESAEDGDILPENELGSAIDGSEPAYTKSLAALVDNWSKLMQASGELYDLNGFDWYCQCQDFDERSGRLVSHKYKLAGKDRIDAAIVFSPARVDGKDSGAPLTFRFRREGGGWKLDDLKFDGNSTLRQGLADDIKAATKEMATRTAD